MTREELLRILSVDDNDIVITDGPFKGQPLYIAYFWFYYITGYTEDKTDDVVTFFVRGEDRVQFKQLLDRDMVRIKQQANGSIIEIHEPLPKVSE